MKNPPGRAANCRASKCPIDKSSKRQASSSKQQAPSSKLQAPSVRQFVALTQDVAATLCHIDTRCSGATLCLMDQGPRMWYYDDYNKTKRAHMRSSMRAVSQPRDISGHKPPYTCEKRLMIRLVAQCTCPGASYSLTCDNLSY